MFFLRVKFYRRKISLKKSSPSPSQPPTPPQQQQHQHGPNLLSSKHFHGSVTGS